MNELKRAGIRDPALGGTGAPCEDVRCNEREKRKTQPNNCPYNHNILKLYKPKFQMLEYIIVNTNC